jgi:two-component system cell cycle response regulator
MTGSLLSRESAPARPRRSVFKELLFSMLAFGTIVGLMFPLFAKAQLHTRDAMSYRFFALCVAAGLIIGAGNFLIFKMVVSRQLSRLASGMQRVNEEVRSAKDNGGVAREACKLAVTSNDLIGDVAASFNGMTDAISRRITVESTTRTLLATLSATAEEAVVAHEILEAIAAVCGAQAGVLYGDTGQTLKLLSSFGVDVVADLPDELDDSQGLAQRALERGQLLCAAPSRDGFAWMQSSTPLGGFRPESIVLVPLMAEQRAVGIAAMACTLDRLSEEQTALLDSIRTQAAPYLHTAILHEKLRDLAAIDDLTKILNRRFGMRRLAEEFSRSARHGVPLSVVMIDIDRFKAFNDTFGHDAGDAVLVSVARVLENSVRAGDVVCRYGGEELMIVAPGMGMNDAGEVAERLRRLIEVTPIIWRDQLLNVTVSMGTASWPIIRASMPEEMVTYADEALYHAKKSGRNQVSVHQGRQVVPVSMLDVSAE